MNILGIIFFSVFFGVALSLLGHEEGCGQIIKGVEAFNQVIIKMVRTATLLGESNFIPFDMSKECAPLCIIG